MTKRTQNRTVVKRSPKIESVKLRNNILLYVTQMWHLANTTERLKRNTASVCMLQCQYTWESIYDWYSCRQQASSRCSHVAYITAVSPRAAVVADWCCGQFTLDRISLATKTPLSRSASLPAAWQCRLHYVIDDVIRPLTGSMIPIIR